MPENNLISNQLFFEKTSNIFSLDDKTASFESIFRELVTPIIRDAVNQTMTEYFSTPPAEQPPSVKEMLNVAETAAFLGVSMSRVYKITHRREVPYYHGGKFVYFKREDLLQWVMKNRISSREEIERQVLN